MAENIMFPPGRMIGGSVDKVFPVLEQDNKTPKRDKLGNPLVDCSIGLAIPKGTEQAWWETEWGQKIYQIGAAAHPNLVASPLFSWKIIDGDSQIPNKAGKRPCDKVGHPGHWVLWFSQGWLPKRVNSTGEVELPEGAIVPGYYIQVYGAVAGNKLVPNGTAGVYLNPVAVALVGEGDKIATDVDTTSVGFGTAPLPAGARPVSPVVPGMPPMGGAPMPGLPPAVPGAPMPGAAVPPMPGLPPAPAPVAAAPARVMTAAAQYTYEQYKASGWTDETLIANGLMLAPAAPPAAPVAPPTPPVGAPPVAPNMAALTPPGAAPGGMPAAPPVPPAPAPVATVPVMLPAANGVTYESFKGMGWTDEQLRASGYMQ